MFGHETLSPNWLEDNLPQFLVSGIISMSNTATTSLQPLVQTVRGDAAASIFKDDEPRQDPLPEFAKLPGTLALVELILKQPQALEGLIHDTRWQSLLVPRFLGIAIAGFALFGVAISLVLSSAQLWPHLTPLAEFVQYRVRSPIVFEPLGNSWMTWWNGSALQLLFAYVFGLIAASGVCLPSLYFYGLLSGIKPTLLDVLMQTLKSKAVSAVALVGILPIYAALALGVTIFQLPQERAVLWLGLILPFIAGLYGVRSLYVGFARLASYLPNDCRSERTCFLRRLVLSWAAIYTTITPAMIYTVWEAIQP